MIKEYGTLDIGPYKVEIRLRRGVWEFLPYYNHNPVDNESLYMNAMIRQLGRIWTPIPEGEIEKVKHVLGIE